MRKIALPLVLSTYAALGTSYADVPSVAVDIAPVHSLVSQVMGTLSEPTLIVSAGASPHGYSLRPSEAQALQDANLVFWVSAGLTPWLEETVVTLAPDATRIELLELEGITALALREGALFEAHQHDHHEHGDEHHDEAQHDEAHHDDEHHEEAQDDHEHDDEEHHDEAHHDHEHHVEAHHDDEHDHHNSKEQASEAHHEHGEHDAHAWLDPSIAILWLDAIATELAKADPENADTYKRNAATAKAELEQLKADVQQILAPVSGRSFIVFHDAYQYFENAYDFPSSGAISLSDASRPSPARIQQIQDRVAQADVTCVLAEPQFNPDLVRTVLDGTNAQSSVVDPLGSNLETGPTLYTKLVRELAQTLADCV